MTRIGYGGTCPCCDEPITFQELLGNENPDPTKTVNPPTTITPTPETTRDHHQTSTGNGTSSRAVRPRLDIGGY